MDGEEAGAIPFTGPVVHWRGPAPFVFVALPEAIAEAIRPAARAASYGWGAVPVEARIGATAFATSLFPREGNYLLPLRIAVQRAERIGVGDEVAGVLSVRPR